MTRTYTGSKEVIVIKQKVDENIITQTRTYKLITPLFGGGAETQKPDAVTTVRATEVRGHLRFWWRATRGGMFNGSLEEMKKAEEKIWGSAAQKGKAGYSEVKITILKASKDKELKTQKVKDKTLHISDPRTDWGYISFPLKDDKEKNKPAGSVWENVNFEMEISYPKNLEEEIEPALWAWETFGGIGGRIRRGFGALELKEKIANSKEVDFSLFSYDNAENELKKELKKYVVTGKWPENVPHLNTEMKMKVIKVASSQANQVLHNLIAQYQSFRQKRHKRLGKSLWPEANELRRRLGQPMNWKPDEVENAELVEKFPRTVFGLPVLMHLPNDGDLTFTIQGKPDPKTGKKYERLSSVLILKPVACANDKAVGIALVLDAPVMPPNGLEIKEPMKNQDPVEWELTKDDVKTNPLNQVMGNKTDVIEAFLNYLK